MNHCGRPECECYRQSCCEKCREWKTCPFAPEESGRLGNNLTCPCHKEKKCCCECEYPNFAHHTAESCWTDGVAKLTKHHTEKPVQENCGCKGLVWCEKHAIAVGPFAAAPIGEGWEERLKAEVGVCCSGDYCSGEDSHYPSIIAFIKNLLAVERDKTEGKKLIAWRDGQKAERERIRSLVEGLRKDYPQTLTTLNILQLEKDITTNATLDAVLKGIDGETS